MEGRGETAAAAAEPMKTFPRFFRSPEELSSDASRRDVRELSFVTGNVAIGGGVDGDRNGWICRAGRA